MLQKIKKIIYQTYSPNDCLWLFFSAFTDTWQLIISQGVVQTDKTLENLLNLFYPNFFQPYEAQISGIVFDIVKELTPQPNIQQFLQLSPQEYGVVVFSLQDGKTGVLLPGTQGINNMQQAIIAIKQKYQLGGNGTFSTFKVERITFQK